MTRRPQVRFLIRAGLLLVCMLALWGALLLDPLRAALRWCTAAAIWAIPGDGSVASVTIDPNGDWSLRLPVPAVVARQDAVQQMFGRASKSAPPVKVRSLKLTIEGKYPVLFTAGLPFYWALLLASGWNWRRWRMLVEGSAILFGLAVASLTFHVIREALRNLHLATGNPGKFLLDSGQYFVINVVPYMAPLLLALYQDAGLRKLVFTRQGDEEAPAAQPKKRKKARAQP